MTSSEYNRPLNKIRIADGIALLALTALVLVFFWKMAFTSLILPRGDIFTYFYPHWAHRNTMLRLGHLPLWNPYLFMGVPFLANSQAGVLYPPNWLLIWLDTPTAVKVAIISHLIWAAAGTYLFARQTLCLDTLGAMLVGVVFALGGYLTAQVEHINQLQGLAWMPWLFWLWNKAVTKQSRATLWLGLAMGMQLLAGHAQSAFISGVGLGAWALWHTIGMWRSWRRGEVPSRTSVHPCSPSLRVPIWPLGTLVLSTLLALGLAAVQILPTLELAQLSNRGGGLPLLEALSFSFKPQLSGRALLPSYNQEPLFSEYVAYVGIVALVLALMGAWGRRRNWSTIGLVGLITLGLLLALGAYTPLYWGLVKFVPGFNLFRAPARWLALWAFSVATLAGIGLDWFTKEAKRQPASSLYTLLLGAIVVALAGLAFLAPLEIDEVPGATSPSTAELIAWAATLVITLALIRRIRLHRGALDRMSTWALATLAIAELFLASQNLPFNSLSTPAAWGTQRPAISTLLAAQEGKMPPNRFLSISDIRFDPGDMRELEAVYGPRLSDKAFYDFVVASKQKEILTPNLPLGWGIPAMDGFDGGVLPTQDYTRFTGLLLPPDTWNPDGRLREHLNTSPDFYWLRLANVGWIITDKVYDTWIDGIYYDLQFAARAQACSCQESPLWVEAYPLQSFEATAVGIVGHLEGAGEAPDGTVIGHIALYADGQERATCSLLVGKDLAEGIPANAKHTTPEIAGHFTPDQPELVEYHSRCSKQAVLSVEHIEISVASSFPGSLVVRGVSLIDGRTGAFMPTSLSHGNMLRIANSGDVKVYEYRDTLPRAYLVCNPNVVGSIDEMWAQVTSKQTPVVFDPDLPAQGDCDPQSVGYATITDYKPERIVIDVETDSDGIYLILSDAWYPGWEAEIDDQPVDVLHANGMFRAVEVPPGEHKVTFTYRSRPLEIGAAISGICLLGTLVGLGVAKSRDLSSSRDSVEDLKGSLSSPHILNHIDLY